MKKLILSLMFLVLMTGVSFADSNQSFSWIQNSESDLAGYRIYRSDTSGGQVIDGVNFIIEVTPLAGQYDPIKYPDLDPARDAVTIPNVPDGTWYWVCTAFDTDGNESPPSNEAVTVVDSIAPIAPTGLEVMGILKN